MDIGEAYAATLEKVLVNKNGWTWTQEYAP